MKRKHRMLSAALAVLLCISPMPLTAAAEDEPLVSLDEQVIAAVQQGITVPVRLMLNPGIPTGYLRDQAYAQVKGVGVSGKNAVEQETERCKLWMQAYLPLEEAAIAEQFAEVFPQLGIDEARVTSPMPATYVDVTLTPDEIEALRFSTHIFSIDYHEPENTGEDCHECAVDERIAQAFADGEETVPVWMFFDVPETPDPYWTLAQDYAHEFMTDVDMTVSEREMVWVKAATALKRQDQSAAVTAYNAQIAEKIGLTEGNYWASTLVGTITGTVTQAQYERAMAFVSEISYADPAEMAETDLSTDPVEEQSGEQQPATEDAADPVQDATEPTTAVVCTAPQFTGMETPMQIGETRKITAYDPAGKRITNMRFGNVPEEIRISYTPGDSYCYITALAPCGLELSVTTDVTAFTGYLSVNVEDKTYEPTPKLGDLNGDLVTNAADASVLLAEAAAFGASQEHTLDTDALDRADTNGDGAIDSADAANILDFSAAVGAARTTRDFPDFMAERGTTLFGWNYYRTNPGLLSDKEPQAFQTRAGLDAYLSSLTEQEKALGTGTQTLDSVTEKYSDAFFADRALLLIPGIPESLSCTYDVESVEIRNNTCYVPITVTCPLFSAALEANWYFIVETSKDAADLPIEPVFREVTESMTDPDDTLRGAQYVRMQTGESYANKPVTAFRTKAEFDAYFADYDLSQETEDVWNLAKAVAKYDEAFFADNALLLIPQERGTGSAWFEVTGLTASADLCTVRMNVYTPQVVTCDMAEWYIFVETTQEAASAAAFDVKIHDVQEPYHYGDDLNAGEHLQSAQYSEVNHYELLEQMDSKPVLFTDREALNAYFVEKMALAETTPSLTVAPSVPLSTALERYTDAFFRYQDVLLIPVRVGCYDISYTVQSVGWDYVAGEFVVKIGSNFQGAGSPLEAGWYIFAEVDKYTYDDMMRVEFIEETVEEPIVD